MIEHNRSFWTRLKTRTVTISVQPREDTAYVFQVINIVDLGTGRQMVVLDGLFPQDHKRRPVRRRNALSMPHKIGRLDFVCTGRRQIPVSDIYKRIRDINAKAHIEPIVPDVLAPGDVVVFRKDRLETFRIVTTHNHITDKADHAL